MHAACVHENRERSTCLFIPLQHLSQVSQHASEPNRIHDMTDRALRHDDYRNRSPGRHQDRHFARPSRRFSTPRPSKRQRSRSRQPRSSFTSRRSSIPLSGQTHGKHRSSRTNSPRRSLSTRSAARSRSPRFTSHQRLPVYRNSPATSQPSTAATPHPTQPKTRAKEILRDIFSQPDNDLPEHWDTTDTLYDQNQYGGLQMPRTVPATASARKNGTSGMDPLDIKVWQVAFEGKHNYMLRQLANGRWTQFQGHKSLPDAIFHMKLSTFIRNRGIRVETIAVNYWKWKNGTEKLNAKKLWTSPRQQHRRPPHALQQPTRSPTSSTSSTC